MIIPALALSLLVLLVPSPQTPPVGAAPSRPRVGLALGGGSAKGIAHVGVLKWLEEHQIPVDAIAGTSTGAFIGGAYATGLSAAEIEELLRTADWDLIMRPDIPYRLKSFRRKEDDLEYAIKLEAGLRQGFRLQSGLNPGHRIGLLLSRVAFPFSTVADFDDLAIPFRCVATDLETGEAVVLRDGPLGPALRASMALPGTFDPVRLNGRLLSDGGILNNVPVDVARGMGVETVIAVSVGGQERDTPAETIGAVASRAIGLMMEQLDEPRLRRADVVILPELGTLGSSDYRKSGAIVALGYAAAAARSEALLPYALNDVDWAEYRRALALRERPKSGPISFVEVFGVSPDAATQIAGRFDEVLGRSPDPDTIESTLDWVIGLGRHASAMYDRRLRGPDEGLGIVIRDKSYGPPFVKFALDVDNEAKDVDLTVGARVTVMDPVGAGSEWRIDTSLGSTLGLSTELLKPLGGRGPLSRAAFLAPRAFYIRTTESLYAESDLRAIYSRQRVGAGFDFGWIIGRATQFRIGYETAFVRNVIRVGDRFPRDQGSEQSAIARFSYNGQDRAYFPTRGARLNAKATWRLDVPEVTRDFGALEAGGSVAFRLSRRHHVSFSADAGLNIGGDPPTLYQFTLGGPFRLSSYPPQAFRGTSFALGRVAYRTAIGRLPDLLGDRLYLTGIVEVGSAFDRASAARVKSSFSGGFVADTFLGPFFAGGSVGSGGDVRAYFLIGSVIR